MTSVKNNFHQPITYFLDFLGCRLNLAETEELARQITGTGGIIVKDPSDANVIVLNTCAVTAQASQRSERKIRKLHQLQPEAEIAVIGCWATEDAKRVKKLPGIKWVLPNQQKSQSVEIITGRRMQSGSWSPGKWGHTRAFLPVQDGCDHHCTYCITQILRGTSRSRPLDEVLYAVDDLVEQGAQEVVLTGVSLGAYGQDQELDSSLSTLVDAILSKTMLPRLRLSSIEPWDVTDGLLQHLSNPRLCCQLHLPLQSGSDSVLRRMGRHITTDQYKTIIDKARHYCPEISVSTDIMAGFPGETECEYQQTVSFIQKMSFSRLHVFAYSERPGTSALKLPGSVPNHIRKIRADRLHSLNKELRNAFRESMLGRCYQVLYQKQVKPDWWMGLTDTYVKVITESRNDLYNIIKQTKIILNRNDHVEGQILS